MRKYGVRIFFWTGDMNTYRHVEINDLTEEEAVSLFKAIEANGDITEVDLLEDGKGIRLKDCFGCEG